MALKCASLFAQYVVFLLLKSIQKLKQKQKLQGFLFRYKANVCNENCLDHLIVVYEKEKKRKKANKCETLIHQSVIGSSNATWLDMLFVPKCTSVEFVAFHGR